MDDQKKNEENNSENTEQRAPKELPVRKPLNTEIAKEPNTRESPQEPLPASPADRAARRGGKAKRKRDRLTIPERYEDDPETILNHAKSRIAGDRKSFLLSKSDRADVLAVFNLRCVKYWSKVAGAKDPVRYLNRMIHHCVCDFLKHRQIKVRVLFRRRARIKGLLEELELNNATLESIKRGVAGKRHAEIWLNAGQTVRLKDDPRVESLCVLFDGVTKVDCSKVSAHNGAHPMLAWEIQEDLETACAELEKEQKFVLPGQVMRLRLFESLPWNEVARRVGKSVKRCQQYFKEILRAIVKRFQELREYLIDIVRNHF